MENPKKNGRLDLSKERWDQNSFLGRYKHFFSITNPFLLLNSSETLEKAKEIVMKYKKGDKVDLPDEEVWRQKALYDSAFHPVTEELMNPVGRMAAQCPINALIMGGMMIFYKTRREVYFWQWINQSFNAWVNNANSSDPRIDLKEASKSYLMAVGSSLGAALLLCQVAKKLGPTAQPFVPFFSVALGNAINIPLCRQKELKEGIQLWFEGKEIAKSKKMAAYGISLVVLSRVMIQVPHMLTLPIILGRMKGTFKKRPGLSVPFQLVYCAGCLFFSVPLGCALFPHKTFVAVDKLEPEVQQNIKQQKNADVVYFNKGL